eukprot:1145658-Pelagomonas_calceolata.AAC.2
MAGLMLLKHGCTAGLPRHGWSDALPWKQPSMTGMMNEEDPSTADPMFWNKVLGSKYATILEQQTVTLGRGRRQRGNVSYGGLDASSSSESISSGVVSADDLREEGEAHNEVQRRKEEQHAVYEHCALGLVCNAAISVWQHLSRKPGNKGNMHTPALGS